MAASEQLEQSSDTNARFALHVGGKEPTQGEERMQLVDHYQHVGGADQRARARLKR